MGSGKLFSLPPRIAFNKEFSVFAKKDNIMYKGEVTRRRHFLNDCICFVS